MAKGCPGSLTVRTFEVQPFEAYVNNWWDQSPNCFSDSQIDSLRPGGWVSACCRGRCLSARRQLHKLIFTRFGF